MAVNDLVNASEAARIMGLAGRQGVDYHVRMGNLKPAVTLPNGHRLFRRAACVEFSRSEHVRVNDSVNQQPGGQQ